MPILNPKKVTQETDIPVKSFKDNKDFLAVYFRMFIHDAITSSKFPSLKMTNIKAVFRKETKSIKITDLSVSYLWFRKLFASN